MALFVSCYPSTRGPRGIEPSIDEAAKDPVAVALQELGNAYMKAAAERRRAMPPDGPEVSDKEMSDDEWLKQMREQDARFPDADEQLLPRFLAFAKAHPDSPYALDALAFVIRRGGPQTGDVMGMPWQLKESAIDAVSEQHMHDPRVVHVFDMLSGSLPSPKTETFLRRAFEQSPQPAVRAAAGLSLARYYCTTSQCLDRCKKIKEKARPLNYERFWKLVVTPYLENLPFDDCRVRRVIGSLPRSSRSIQTWPRQTEN